MGAEVQIRIRPSRHGPVHTINRAKLIALLHALSRWQEQDDLVIATDSAFAMQSINQHLQNPKAHRYHKHKNLFHAITKQLLMRAEKQQHTSIVKVKSHIQIMGNEMADALAVEACEQWDVDMCEEHIEPFEDMIWVTKSLYDENGEVNGAPYLSDLEDALKTSIHCNKHLGQSNRDTIYFRAWRDIAQHMVADVSNGYWEEDGKVTDAMLRNTNKAKTGQLWHKGKAYLWKMPYTRGGPVATDNRCPLCSQPDSGSHILGGCAHPEMKMIIHRHDEAHRIILNEINKGTKGSHLIIADVGTADTLGKLGVHHKRIPECVLPTSMLALHTTHPNELRTKLRPDIMMVELQEREQSTYQSATGSMSHRVLPSSVMDNRLGHSRQRKIWIVEGGYCADKICGEGDRKE